MGVACFGGLQFPLVVDHYLDLPQPNQLLLDSLGLVSQHQLSQEVVSLDLLINQINRALVSLDLQLSQFRVSQLKICLGL